MNCPSCNSDNTEYVGKDFLTARSIYQCVACKYRGIKPLENKYVIMLSAIVMLLLVFGGVGIITIIGLGFLIGHVLAVFRLSRHK